MKQFASKEEKTETDSEKEKESQSEQELRKVEEGETTWMSSPGKGKEKEVQEETPDKAEQQSEEAEKRKEKGKDKGDEVPAPMEDDERRLEDEESSFSLDDETAHYKEELLCSLLQYVRFGQLSNKVRLSYNCTESSHQTM